MIRITLLAAAFLVSCGAGGPSKTVQQDPIFKDNYIVRDPDGRKVGYAVKVSPNEYRLFTDDGKKVILRDPIFDENYLIFDDRVGE